MAGSINVSSATDEMLDESFVMSAVLIVVGSLVASLATSWMRSNVYDVQITGGDAIYPIVAAFLMLLVLPQQYAKPAALGSVASSVRVILADFNIV
jgi:hypothetical protein